MRFQILKNIVGWSILFMIFLSLITYENILHFKKGPPLLGLDPYNFAYKYVEIYKRFFRRAYSPKEGLIYKPQRSRCSSKFFPIRKEKGTKRIFVIGGSVALIFNKDSKLQNLLGSLMPGTKFEVIGCGMGEYDSYRESLVLNEIIHYNPDLIIVMSGNNEYFFPVHLNPFAYRLNKFFRKFWIYRLLQDKTTNQYENYQVNTKSILSNFKNNLITMINKAKANNIPIALCTLPVNFRDMPPSGLQPLQEKQYFEAWYCFNEGKFAEAKEKFKDFLAKFPQNAFANYFLAQCYDRLGDYHQAKSYYMEALDLDTNPGDRCSPSRNKVIRELSTKNDVILVDLEKAFFNSSENGLLGSDFFIDNCHWLDKFNFVVYNEIVQSIVQYDNTHLRQIFINPNRNNLQDTKKLLLNSSLKEKTKEDLLKESFRWLLYAFKESSANFANDNINERAIYSLKIAYELNSGLFEDKISLKKQIIKKLSTNIWTEKLLDDFNKNWPIFLYYIGESYRRLGLYHKAVEYFNDAATMSGADFWLLFLGRGIAYYKLGKLKEARIDFDKTKEKSKDCSWLSFYEELLGV